MSTQRKGIFGKLISAYHVNDVSGREALDRHFLMWTKINLIALQKMAVFKEVVNVVLKHMDAISKSSLPENVHYENITRVITYPNDRLPMKPIRYKYETCPLISSGNIDCEQFETGVRIRAKKHQHVVTCHYRKNG